MPILFNLMRYDYNFDLLYGNFHKGETGKGKRKKSLPRKELRWKRKGNQGIAGGRNEKL